MTTDWFQLAQSICYPTMDTPKPNRITHALNLCSELGESIQNACCMDRLSLSTASRELLMDAKEQLRVLRMTLARAHEVSEEKGL